MLKNFLQIFSTSLHLAQTLDDGVQCDTIIGQTDVLRNALIERPKRDCAYMRSNNHQVLKARTGFN